MTFKDSLEFENKAATGTIRLVSNGSFYRALNHSAWLFQCCISEFKVMRKYVKALKSDIFFIGFPKEKLQDVVGSRKIESTAAGFDITLGEDELPDEAGYETWLATVEAEAASKADYNALPIAGADAEREVIRQLREFPFENTTVIDCVVFLAKLRGMLGNK